MQEMRRKQEETRQRELEERRRKEAEAKRKRLEDAEKKRLVMQEAIRRRDEEAKRNFIVPKRTADAAQSGPMIIGMRDGEWLRMNLLGVILCDRLSINMLTLTPIYYSFDSDEN